MIDHLKNDYVKYSKNDYEEYNPSLVPFEVAK